MDNKKLAKGVLMLAAFGAGALALQRYTVRTSRGRALRRAAEKTREHVSGRLAKIGRVSRRGYGKIVDAAIEEIGALKKLSARELEELSADLKTDWQDIRFVFKKEEHDEDEELT